MEHRFSSVRLQGSRGLTIASAVIAAGPVHPTALVSGESRAVTVEGEKVRQRSGVFPTRRGSQTPSAVGNPRPVTGRGYNSGGHENVQTRGVATSGDAARRSARATSVRYGSADISVESCSASARV